MAKNMLSKLPPELRIRIYEFALPIGVPVKRKATQNTEPPDEANAAQRVVFLSAGLLFVDRLTYKEALPIFYKTNTISVRRSDVCGNAITGNRKHLSDLEPVVHLHFSDFAITPWCATPIANCNKCCESALNLLCLPPLFPHLRTITVDYGANDQSLEAFTLFKSALKAAKCDNPDYTLICTGIGQYKLQSTNYPNLDITMTHAELARCWVTATPASVAAACQARKPSLRHSMEHGVNALLRRHDGLIPSFSNVKLIPDTLARAWPRDKPCDFRKAGEVETLAFLETFDDALMVWLKAFADDVYMEVWVRGW